MATPRVNAEATDVWVNVIGTASGIPGVTWQCNGPGALAIAFTAAAPTNGPNDAVHKLKDGDAFYDKNGSTAAWIKRIGRGQATIAATSD